MCMLLYLGPPASVVPPLTTPVHRDRVLRSAITPEGRALQPSILATLHAWALATLIRLPTCESDSFEVISTIS